MMLALLATLNIILPNVIADEYVPSNYAPDIGWQSFEATAYVADCAGCIGVTKTGIDVRNTIWHGQRRIIAVDPSVVALGSIVEVRQADGYRFEAVAGDVGGAIDGREIDVLVGDEEMAWEFGRQGVQIRIIENGGIADE